MVSRMGWALLLAAVPAVAAPPTDACGQLTAAQVSSAVGQTVGAGKNMGAGFTKTCNWVSEGMIVTLLVEQNTTMFDAGKSNNNPGVVRAPASGVGDDAYYMGTGGGVALWVKKDGGYFKMSVYTRKLSPDLVKAAEMTLAQQVAAKF